jgi:type I restriction enzyme, R subunit
MPAPGAFCFLVDRRTLGRQALNEFQQFSIPGDGRKFTEIYNVQLLSSNAIDPVCRVAITTIQRLYSILKAEPDYDPGNEETSAASLAQLRNAPDPIEYHTPSPLKPSTSSSPTSATAPSTTSGARCWSTSMPS